MAQFRRELTARFVRGSAAVDTLAPDCDRILQTCLTGIRGPDLTCSSVWARALLKSLLDGVPIRSLVISAGDQVVGVLHTYSRSVGSFLLQRRELRMLTEANHGRPSLLVAGNDPAIAKSALEFLIRDPARWDAFILTVVANSACHHAVARAVEQLSLRTRVLSLRESPYIELSETWQEVLASLPKKTRWTMRKGERDLTAKGTVTYEQFETPDSVDRLREAMLTIERRSWKEATGTSITANSREQNFYDAFLPLAARNSMMSGHVLSLDGKPLAYILGARDEQGTFLDLKESFDASWAACSPGHVLKRFALERLIQQGVRTYDFMGRCEPYKMRWTDKTYERITLAIYRPSASGLMAYARSRVRDATRLLRPGVSGKTDSPVSADL